MKESFNCVDSNAEPCNGFANLEINSKIERNEIGIIANTKIEK